MRAEAGLSCAELTRQASIPRNLTVSELKPYHLTKEMNSHPTWGPDTRANFARCVQRAFRRARKQGLIRENAVEHVVKPGKQKREVFYTREEYDLLLTAFPDREMRDVSVRGPAPRRGRLMTVTPAAAAGLRNGRLAEEPSATARGARPVKRAPPAANPSLAWND